MPWSTSRPGSSTQRGYGKDHRKLRKLWEPVVAAGGVNCWRCGRPIVPGMNWHLGHADWDRNLTMGPEHVRCNLSGAARKAQRIQAVRRRPVIVDRW